MSPHELQSAIITFVHQPDYQPVKPRVIAVPADGDEVVGGEGPGVSHGQGLVDHLPAQMAGVFLVADLRAGPLVGGGIAAGSGH